jgi:hypothetical protein
MERREPRTVYRRSKTAWDGGNAKHRALVIWTGAGAAGFVICASLADPLPPSASYRQLPTLPFAAVKANDEVEKRQVTQDQQAVLNQRYDPSDHPIPGVMMSGGRKAVQGGVRVKLPDGELGNARRHEPRRNPRPRVAAGRL